MGTGLRRGGQADARANIGYGEEFVMRRWVDEMRNAVCASGVVFFTERSIELLWYMSG